MLLDVPQAAALPSCPADIVCAGMWTAPPSLLRPANEMQGATSRIPSYGPQDAASGATAAASEAAGSAAGAVRSTESVGEAQRSTTESGGAQPRLAGGVPAVQHGVS